jgi:hypothetical protein
MTNKVPIISANGTSRRAVHTGNATKGTGADIASGSTSGPVRIGGVPKKALASVFRVAAKAKGDGSRDGTMGGKGTGLPGRLGMQV